MDSARFWILFCDEDSRFYLFSENLHADIMKYNTTMTAKIVDRKVNITLSMSDEKGHKYSESKV